MLSKFFLMPVKDEADPDYREGNNKKQKDAEELTPTQQKSQVDQVKQRENAIEKHQVESLISLFRQKTADNKERQTNFCKELDQLLIKQGIEGTTTSINFRTRLSLLSPNDYQ